MKKRVSKIIVSSIITFVMCFALCSGISSLRTEAARKDPRVLEYVTMPSGQEVIVSENGLTYYDWSKEDQQRAVFIYQEGSREDAILYAPEKTTVKFTEKEDVNTLSHAVMQALVKRPDVTLDFSFVYDNKHYNVIIPAGKAVDDDIEWYGPLFLIGTYGGTEVKQ